MKSDNVPLAAAKAVPQVPAETSRRAFLSTTAVTAGSLPLLTSPLQAAVHRQGDETLKVAVIGCGGRGSGAVAQALGTSGPVKLWAMADAFRDRLDVSLGSLSRGLEKRYDQDAGDVSGRVDVSEDRKFVGLDAYRHAIDSGVEVVIITGPPAYRPLHFEYAIKAGKHVFMEKPVATDAVGVRRILQTAKLADEKGLKVGVGLQRHHQASYLETLRRINNGDIGKLQSLRCYWNTGNPAKKPFPREGLTELEYQIRNWYFFTWLSGDHICEQHIHNLDVCNWIMNDHPVSAEGVGGRQVRTGAEYGQIFDHHAVEYTYANGMKMFSQCRQIPGCVNQVAEFAHGDKGVAELSQVQCSIRQGAQEIWKSERKAANPYQVEHDDLFDAIRNNKPYNEAVNGAMSTMTAILGRMATYSGKRIQWDEAIASELSLTTDAEDWNAAAPILPDEDGRYPVAKPGTTKVL
ncbi:MAG: Gfo/Idh/MocA family oxidoreductase [Planctomycetaceae bacterium]|nr:Gfo/Idh/MocA family oxidoreductase [Planctomycetaceae bacterium]